MFFLSYIFDMLSKEVSATSKVFVKEVESSTNFIADQ